MDLGLAAQYQADAKDKADELAKKRRKDAQTDKLVPAPFSAAYLSLTGNQY